MMFSHRASNPGVDRTVHTVWVISSVPHHACHSPGHHAATVTPQQTVVTDVLELTRVYTDRTRKTKTKRKSWRLSAMRGQRQKMYCQYSPAHKDLILAAHVHTQTKSHTWVWRERVNWHEGVKLQANRRDSCKRYEEAFWQKENKMVFYQLNVLHPQESNGKEVATKLLSNFAISWWFSFIALSICCSLREKP